MLEKKSLQILSSMLFLIIVVLTFLSASLNQIYNEKLQAFQTKESTKIFLLGVLQTAVDDLELLSRNFSEENAKSLIENKNRYSQIRLIDLNGKELIRYNRYRGNIWKTKDEDLQNKSNRYYFQKTLNLNSNQFYVSSFDSNFELGKAVVGELTFRVAIRLKSSILILNISSEFLKNQSYILAEHIVSVDNDGSTSLIHALISGERLLQIKISETEVKTVLDEDIVFEEWSFFVKKDFSESRRNTFIFMGIFLLIISVLLLIFRLSKKKDEQLIMLQNTLKNLIFDSSIFSLTDSKGNIISVNKSFQDITGYSEQELLGKNHNIISSGYHDKLFYQGLWKKLKNGLIWKGRIKNKKKDGSYFWVYSVIAPIFNHKSKIVNFASLSFEVTKEVLAEEKIQNMRNYNIENIGRMSAQMAHQFGTPLAIIQTSSDILKDLMKVQNIMDERINSQLEGIDKSIENITKITRLIKMIGRRSHDKLAKGTTCNLAEVVDAAGQSIAIERRQDASQITISGIEKECFVEGHFTLFLQVFVNLFDNSYQATDSANRKIELTKISEDEKTLVLELIDNGPGIEHAHLDKVFDPYYTTKDMSEGTGLGLSFCREIMEMFSGSIEYISGRGGACFKLIFKKV